MLTAFDLDNDRKLKAFPWKPRTDDCQYEMQSLKKGIATLVVSSSALFAYGNYKRFVFAKEAKDVNDAIVDTGETKDVKHRLNITKAVSVARDLVERHSEEYNVPGVVIGVSWKGQNVWVQGFGFSDLELGAKCHESTVMRIASLSKCITMLLVAKLVEENKLDLDASIYKYLNGVFPEKKWDGKPVDITIRQLASHLAGIRHYENGNKKDSSNGGDTEFKEFFIKDKYESVFDALNIFKNDDLIAKPGTELKYTTHGYTLLSAAVQHVLPKEEKFGDYLISNICRRDLGMNSTYLDEFEPIIYNRSKYYWKKGKNGQLMNAPYVDNSCKWAGGGLLSTVPDILKFANVLLYSYKGELNGVPGYLKKSTIETLWTPTKHSKIGLSKDLSQWTQYALGFGVIKNGVPKYASCNAPPFQEMIFHSGGAMGASSFLLIIPEYELTVAVICNLGNCPGLGKLVLSVAKSFAENITKVGSNNSFIEL